MSIQINVKLSENMFSKASSYIESHGYENIQGFIRELLREKLFEDQSVSGLSTYLASEQSLAKHWLSQEEEQAWAHLQKAK